MKKILLGLFFFLCSYAVDVYGQPDSSLYITQIQSQQGYVVVNNDYNNCIKISKTDTLRFEPGEYNLNFLQEGFRDRTVKVSLNKGQVERKSLTAIYIEDLNKRKDHSTYARCFWDSNVIILSDSKSQIFVEEQYISDTNVRLQLDPGQTYTTTSTIGSVKYTKNFTASNELTVISNYILPLKETVTKRSFIPGYAQITKRENLKGYLFFGLVSAFSYSSIYSQIEIHQSKNTYDDLRIEYSDSSNPNDILRIIDDSNKELDNINKFKKIRNLSVLTGLVVYAYNIYDGFKPPKMGFRNEYFRFNPYIDFDKDMLPRANIKLDF